MDLHRSTGRWRLGLALALVTALIWGLLPLALKFLVGTLDPVTITWARFLGAGALLAAARAHRQRPSLGRVPWMYGLLVLATLGMCGNYALYLAGLRLTTPSTAQLVTQLAPLFLMGGSMLLFGERFCRAQWLGLGVLLGGLGLYFGGRVDVPGAGLAGMAGGVLLVVAGAASWAVYALAQKQLLRDFTPDFVLPFVYLAGALLLWPAAQPALVLVQSWPRLLLLAVTALVTLVSYRCFSGALQHLEGARVSVVLSLSPLITVSGVAVAASLVPQRVHPEQLGAAGLLGALLVVGGSALTALAGRE
ncbi:MAG: DMT family transporter [Candidatus Latescibacterota bacterium]